MRAIRMMAGFMLGMTTIVAILWLLSVLWQAPILILAVMFFPFSMLFVNPVSVILAVVHVAGIAVMANITAVLLDG